MSIVVGTSKLSRRKSNSSGYIRPYEKADASSKQDLLLNMFPESVSC